jgi:hypothetical protein
MMRNTSLDLLRERKRALYCDVYQSLDSDTIMHVSIPALREGGQRKRKMRDDRR